MNRISWRVIKWWCGQDLRMTRRLGSTSWEFRSFPPTWPFWTLRYAFHYLREYYCCSLTQLSNWCDWHYSSFNRSRDSYIQETCILNVWRMSPAVATFCMDSVRISTASWAIRTGWKWMLLLIKLVQLKLWDHWQLCGLWIAELWTPNKFSPENEAEDDTDIDK